jgi:hypothetical protein
MASSTTIPKAIIKANREIIFNDTPRDGRNKKEPIKAIGIPAITQNARRISRNKARVINTRVKPKALLRNNKSMR